MRLKLPNILNDPKDLSNAFGFQIPRAFAELIIALNQYNNQNIEKTDLLFEQLTNLMLDGIDARYQQTPPELFPFASLGVDGVHYGFVIHTPELPAEDYPIGQICPMDKDGVLFVGNNTKDALENLIADVINHDKNNAEGISRLSELLGLQPNTERAQSRYDSAGNGLSVPVTIPLGWKYVSSSDGIGVVAPLNKFDPSMDLNTDKLTSNKLITLADKSLSDNFPASALYYLREGYWNNWTDNLVALEFSKSMASVYKELNRQVLADVVEWRVNKFFRK